MAEKKLRTQWSKEPDEEPDYSDWKITLAIKKASDDPAARPLTRSSSSKPKTKKTPPSSSSSVTFSVHRNILGPQSEYFNRIFKSNDSGGFSEARRQHSNIDFPSTISVKVFRLIVKAFEALLKYCYLENVDLEGAAPVPLLHFCDYFQMEDDFENKVEEYSKTHFNDKANEDKLHLLYQQIIDFRTAGLNVERAQTIAAESCFCTMDVLLRGSPLALIIDLPLWLDVALIIQERVYKDDEINIENSSLNWSMNIANFLENNVNSSAVDANSFQKLTGEDVLPYVDVDAALVLLQEEQKYVPSEVPISDDNKNDVEQGESSSLLTNLQNRCLESFVEARLELNSNKKLRDRAMKVMILLPNRVMGMYLNKTLNSYGEEKAQLFHEAQEKARERYDHDAKRRKLEQDNSRLKNVVTNVEQELETEKEKNRLFQAEKMNDRTPQAPVLSLQQRVQQQKVQQQRAQQQRAQRIQQQMVQQQRAQQQMVEQQRAQQARAKQQRTKQQRIWAQQFQSLK